MPKRKTEATLLVDPTMPTSHIKIGDTTYRMCFDFGALAQAEAKLQAQGVEVNILASIRLTNISSVQTLFAASLHKHHPDLSWDDACNLVTWQTYPLIAPTVAYALAESLAEPKPDAKEEADPQKP